MAVLGVHGSKLLFPKQLALPVEAIEPMGTKKSIKAFAISDR